MLATAPQVKPHEFKDSTAEVDPRLERFQAALARHSPLVTMDRIKAHVLLVSAMRVTLHDIEEFKDHVNPTDVLRAYLSRGNYRFELWLNKIVGSVPVSEERKLLQEELPPLDVVMFWHAYVLRPHRLFEAGVTDYPQLYALGPLPLEALV